MDRRPRWKTRGRRGDIDPTRPARIASSRQRRVRTSGTVPLRAPRRRARLIPRRTRALPLHPTGSSPPPSPVPLRMALTATDAPLPRSAIRRVFAHAQQTPAGTRSISHHAHHRGATARRGTWAARESSAGSFRRPTSPPGQRRPRDGGRYPVVGRPNAHRSYAPSAAVPGQQRVDCHQHPYDIRPPVPDPDRGQRGARRATSLWRGRERNRQCIGASNPRAALPPFSIGTYRGASDQYVIELDDKSWAEGF
jgi:hypothetical protein